MSGDTGSTELQFVCPACRRAVAREADDYTCSACDRRFPVLFGIPDFRIRPDRYLSIADERAKASRLHDFARTAGFDALVDFYYSITDDVPPELAGSFARYVRDAPNRGRAVLAELPPQGTDDALLDLGCGSGGTLFAARERFDTRVGVDIGLRWLVICRHRLAEAGVPAVLVCADVEALPFADGGFSHVIADDLIEHAYDPQEAVAAAGRQLRLGGLLWVSAMNRYWVGPHPAVGLWAAGLMPKRLRSRMLRALRGVDALRNMGFVSPASVMQAAGRQGLTVEAARARPLDARAIAGRSPGFRVAATAYGWLRSVAVSRRVLLWLGPTFEIVFRRPVEIAGSGA